MPVSDKDHAEVLLRLGNQDGVLEENRKTLDRILSHAVETNGRIQKLELTEAIQADRRERAEIEAVKRDGSSVSRKTLWIASLAMLAGWGTIVAVILAHA